MEQEIKLTGALEDYLKAVYLVEKTKGEVRITDIALYMTLTKPSVIKAMAILKTNGLLEHEKYGLIKLTEKGRDLAEEINFRHKVLTDFLEKTLGIESKTAEKDACKMEHVISTQTLKKLVEYMNLHK